MLVLAVSGASGSAISCSIDTSDFFDWRSIIGRRRSSYPTSRSRCLSASIRSSKERHIKIKYPGHLDSIDTFMVGHLKGVGRVYMQTVLDCHSRHAWGRLCTSKIPLTAVHVMNNDVLPFFEQHQVKIETVLSDNGREYRGRADQYPFKLFLQLEDIEHRTTPIRRSQSNGFVERFHRTILNEHFRVKGRTKFYEAVDEMQQNLDEYLK